MSHDQEHRIRTRAYELWEQAGCTGRAEEHWCQAEHELTELSEPGERSGSAEHSSSGPGLGVAMACGAKLPSFYDSLPGEAPPLRHWELAIDIAAGPEHKFRDLLTR